MNLLLTSSGIANPSIHRALLDLLGKPVEESRALVIPTAIYPFPGGTTQSWVATSGHTKSAFAGLGWESVGVLELSVLPSIEPECWVPAVQECDALLVWGGDPVFLAYWMHHSGLAEVLATLGRDTVYFGVSAGSIATATTFVESYPVPRRGVGDELSSEYVIIDTPDGDRPTYLVSAHGLGLVDFAIMPHVESTDPNDVAISEQWAAKIPVPSYALDDQSAVMVRDGAIEVVSEGVWKLFSA